MHRVFCEAYSGSITVTKRCEQCGSDLVAQLTAARFCPQCSAPLDHSADAAPWGVVARFVSLAEVGYFADVLEGLGISTHVRQHHEFSAMDGSWRTLYLLEVPRAQSSAAIEALKSELEVMGLDEIDAAQADNFADAADRPSSGRIWKPVVFVLVASSLAYCVGQENAARRQAAAPREHAPKREIVGGAIPDRPRGTRTDEKGDPRLPPAQQTLWESIRSLPAPLASEPEPGQPRHRLRYEKQDNTVVLEEDRDGDGLYDFARRFRGEPVVGQTAE
jgi:hypothetical protein